MKSELILIGGGGHCKSCIDVIELTEAFQIAGIVDVPTKINKTVLGYKVIGTDEDLDDILEEYRFFLITIGQIKCPKKRQTLYDFLIKKGASFPPIISPLAYVSPHTEIGDGTIIMHHAIVNADARVGKNCIINNRALIEHDARVGDHCHIATGAILNGHVKINARTFIGSNAVCHENIEIGADSVIGLGTKVRTSLPSESIVK